MVLRTSGNPTLTFGSFDGPGSITVSHTGGELNFNTQLYAACWLAATPAHCSPNDSCFRRALVCDSAFGSGPLIFAGGGVIRANVQLFTVLRPIEVRQSQVFLVPGSSSVANRLLITDGELTVNTAPMRATNFTCVGSCFLGR